MDKRLKQLKRDYQSIPIPAELDNVVNQALKIQSKKKKIYRWPAVLTAAAILLLTISVNISPALAHSLSEIPVIGKVIDIVTFSEMKEHKNNSSINVKTPAIQGLNNSSLEDNLNTKYVEESKQLYQEFEKLMASLKEGQNGNTSIISDYQVLTNNKIILSIRRTTEISQASTYIENKYDTVDKEKEVLITLKSLFKDDSYIKIISSEIKKQMRQQMKQDSNNMYFIEKGDPAEFKQIKKDQNFYINKDGKLVIAFNEYEVAPGFMGPVEFVIPTETLTKILVGNRYIK